MIIYTTFLLLSFLFGLHIGYKAKEIPLPKVRPKRTIQQIQTKPKFVDQFETMENVAEKPFITHHVKSDAVLMSEEWEVIKIA
jgi:hypothetical protein